MKYSKNKTIQKIVAAFFAFNIIATFVFSSPSTNIKDSIVQNQIKQIEESNKKAFAERNTNISYVSFVRKRVLRVDSKRCPA